ncbi:alpha/beta fold hydrolase [Stackebrandtia nassauensis]|uniref:alpha/beta fold hydrolase n=1 Tax=Stackebrandtia nassauensis TaxID=283811 RepID=UPI001B7F93FC|nr:alpha/beta fold hydrolase [Stackebrandtia nassauensis]
MLALVGGVGVWWWATSPPPHTTEDLRIAVDGKEPTKLDARLYLPETQPAPAVLLSHGFGGTKDTVVEEAEQLVAQGYVVLTYTARGFGDSGGKIHMNAPDYEVNDASQLLDFLADRDEVKRDGADDPQVAAVGASYGGALSLLLAGHDDRVDAIVPQVTWNSLADSLFPNGTGDGDGVFKQSWAGLFYANGLGAVAPQQEAPDGEESSAEPGQQGQVPPQPGVLPTGENPACGRWADDVCEMYQDIAATGRISESAKKLLDASSPQSILDKIEAPTLLVQGQADTLFDLNQANANAKGITEAPVKVAWFSGGHDAMGTESDQNHVEVLTGEWLYHYLRGEGDKPDDSFTFSRISGVTSSSIDLATLGMTTPKYPGMEGSTSPATEDVKGREEQTIASPPGGTPAAISTIPAFGQLASLPGAGIARDIPGQFAMAETEPIADEPVDVVGSPKVRLKVASDSGEAVLFVKLYDVADTGEATLPNGLIAPVRLTGLESDIDTAEEVEVELPGIVRRVEPGHKLRVVVATSDQAYAGPQDPAEYTVQIRPEVELPQTPASPLPSQDAAWHTALIVLLVGIPVAIVAAIVIARLRHRRTDRSVEAETADTPLVVRGLRKVYGDGFVAVDGVDYQVQRGQVMGLLGPNGAGKTTTLRVLMGLLQPTEGEIRVFGHQVTPGAPVLSRLGALVEGPGLLPHLSGIDNLKMYWRSTGRPWEDARIDRVVEIADLGDRINRKVGRYSHGMKQRIAIAQAMLGLPELLVLDEPTDGLDPPQIAEMRRVLHDYASDGRAVLVSSHLLAEVEQTCTHVVVMSRGKVVAAGPVADIIGTGEGHRLEDAFLELVEQK